MSNLNLPYTYMITKSNLQHDFKRIYKRDKESLAHHIAALLQFALCCARVR